MERERSPKQAPMGKEAPTIQTRPKGRPPGTKKKKEEDTKKPGRPLKRKAAVHKEPTRTLGEPPCSTEADQAVLPEPPRLNNDEGIPFACHCVKVRRVPLASGVGTVLAFQRKQRT